ncbi:MAG: biopolymer transporter ExbD [Phycisphaerales bacterium]|nr:MAG: biopolymer transporter ExbD [Phycisphaerales bacterium]
MFKSVRSRRTLTGQAEIQMTPLIDMVFILLIFFVVTTSFVSETGIGIERPQASLSESLPRESIRVAVRADGQIVVGGQETGLFSVRPYVERRMRNQPSLAVVIVADRSVPVDRIVRVMDEIRAGGATDVALATEKGE